MLGRSPARPRHQLFFESQIDRSSGEGLHHIELDFDQPHFLSPAPAAVLLFSLFEVIFCQCPELRIKGRV